MSILTLLYLELLFFLLFSIAFPLPVFLGLLSMCNTFLCKTMFCGSIREYLNLDLGLETDIPNISNVNLRYLHIVEYEFVLFSNFVSDPIPDILNK